MRRNPSRPVAVKAVDANGKPIKQGDRVKSVVGAYHETMEFYGRVTGVEGACISVRKENPGNEPPHTRSAARLWVLASENEKATHYPTTEPWSLKKSLARAAEKERLIAQARKVDAVMNITTQHRVEHNSDGKTARLIIEVFIDGEATGNVTALSGPATDVEAFTKGEITLAEIRQRWTPRKRRA